MSSGESLRAFGREAWARIRKVDGQVWGFWLLLALLLVLAQLGPR